jgi:hypothetical protein
MAKEIKAQWDEDTPHEGTFGGWLDGKRTYLWFGLDSQCKGTLAGSKLYRLAKVIVCQFENGRKQGHR